MPQQAAYPKWAVVAMQCQHCLAAIRQATTTAALVAFKFIFANAPFILATDHTQIELLM
jgi:hypothetical protein